MRTVEYTFVKSSGIDILQYTESVSLPKSIQSCKWHVRQMIYMDLNRCLIIQRIKKNINLI